MRHALFKERVKGTKKFSPTIWINGLHSNKNLTLLSRVQRLANILITGALPSIPGNVMNKINGMIPIDNWIGKEALKGGLRLKGSDH